MTDGTLSIRRRDPKASEAQNLEEEKEALQHGAFEFFATGMLGNVGEGHVKSKLKSLKPQGVPGELHVVAAKRKKLKEYDRLLKSFKYRAALDSVLRKV